MSANGSDFPRNAACTAAVRLALRGFRVFPLRPDSKRPLHKGWQAWATSDVLKIAHEWPEGYWPGIATDEYVVLDADAGKGGLEAIETLGLPQTLTFRSGSGGRHFILKPPAGAEFQTRACTVKGDGTQVPAIVGAWGIDVRAKGGLIVGPGSRIGDRVYAIEIDAPIAELPAHLAERLRAAPVRAQNVGAVLGDLDTPAAIQQAKAYLLTQANLAMEGMGGDNTTYETAARMFDFGLSQETALELMAEHWNDRCSPPWDFDDLAKKVSNARAYRQDPVGRDNLVRNFDHVAPAEQHKPLAPVRMSDVSEKPVAWSWYPYLPAGHISLLGGRGGDGKGLVAASLAAAVTTKGLWPLSQEQAAPGSVLWCEAEDAPSQTLKPRFRAAGADCERIELVTPKVLPAFDLKSYIRAKNVRLIVLSPLVAFLKGLEDINSELGVRKALEILQDAIEDTQCGVIGIVHVNKKPDLAAVEKVLGSVAFTNFVRSVLLVAREDREASPPKFRFVHVKANLSPLGRDLLYSPECSGLDPRGQDVRVRWALPEANVDPEGLYDRKKKANRPPTAGDWLVDYLRTNGATPKVVVIEAAEAAGHDKLAIQKAHHRDQRCKHKTEGFPGKAIWWFAP